MDLINFYLNQSILSDCICEYLVRDAPYVNEFDKHRYNIKYFRTFIYDKLYDDQLRFYINKTYNYNLEKEDVIHYNENNMLSEIVEDFISFIFNYIECLKVIEIQHNYTMENKSISMILHSVIDNDFFYLKVDTSYVNFLPILELYKVEPLQEIKTVYKKKD